MPDCPDDMVGIDGPLRGFDTEMGDFFFERGDRDSGAYGKLEMSYNGIEIIGIALPLGMLGMEEVGRRGVGIDRIQISEAKGIGEKRRCK